MTKEQLMEMGLSAEQADKVIAEHNKSVKAQIDGNYVPKATFEAEREKTKDLTSQVSDRDKQIKELGKFKGTAEELEAQVAKLTEDNNTAKKEYDAKIEKLTQENAIRSALAGKVIDVDDAIPRIDASKLVIKEGKVESGIDEQLVELKKAKPHWFPADQAENKTPTGWIIGNTPPEGKGGTEATNKASDFGKQMAQSTVQGATISAKVQEHYFK